MTVRARPKLLHASGLPTTPTSPAVPTLPPQQPRAAGSWAELGRPLGAGPGRRRRADVRAWGRPGVVRRGAGPAVGAVAGSLVWAVGSALALLPLCPSPGQGLGGPAPARHGAVGAPRAATLSLGAAASAARGHHAYP